MIYVFYDLKEKLFIIIQKNDKREKRHCCRRQDAWVQKEALLPCKLPVFKDYL